MLKEYLHAYDPVFEDDLPTIIINNRQDRELIEELFQSLLQSNEPPWLFQRDGFLTRVVHTEDGGLRHRKSRSRFYDGIC